MMVEVQRDDEIVLVLIPTPMFGQVLLPPAAALLVTTHELSSTLRTCGKVTSHSRPQSGKDGTLVRGVS